MGVIWALCGLGKRRLNGDKKKTWGSFYYIIVESFWYKMTIL
jgi:hypothetical protein